MIFDTHAHYKDEAFDKDRKELLELLYNEGISGVVEMAASVEELDAALELAKQYDHVYAALGIHPDECLNLTEKNMEHIKELAGNTKVVAIGEIGLDYYGENKDSELQKKWFRRQLRLAKELNLPVNVHSRDAAYDTMSVLKEEEFKGLRGIIHCFSYSLEMAREYVDMGYYIGVGGVVTFKNGKKLQSIVEDIPLERIVLETDCPYLSPVPYRGRRNSSLYLTYVIDKIADIRNIKYEEVEKVTYENALKVYGLK